MQTDEFFFKKYSIVKSILTFLVITIAVYVGAVFLILKPSVDTSFKRIFDATNSSLANSYAQNIRLYLHDREQALKAAIAELLLSEALADENISASLLDNIKNLKVLGEDPNVALAEKTGNIIFQEPEYKRVSGKKETKLNISGGKSYFVRILNDAAQAFEITLPIINNKEVKGYLIVQFFLDYKRVIPGLLSAEGSPKVILSDGYSSISWPSSQVDGKLNSPIKADINEYGLNLKLYGDAELKQGVAFEVLLSFIFSVFSGLCLMLFVLFVLARRLIVFPFERLLKQKNIIESAVGGIALVDCDLNFVSVNRSFFSMFKCPEEYFYNKNINQLFNSIDGFFEGIKSIKNKNNRFEFEFKGLDGCESDTFFRLTVVGQFNEKQRCTGYVFFSQDVTALKSVEKDKLQLISELSQKNKDLEQFLFVASHDLKAPLRGIQHTASWVLEDCSHILPPTSKKYLTLMMNRIKRMRQLLDDLLDYSFAESVDNNLQYIDIRKTINDFVDLHLTPFGFSSRLHAMPKNKILIPKVPFEIIIRNLFDNAVKHHHKEHGLIEVSFEEVDNTYRFKIKDDGPGVKPEIIDKIFNAFYAVNSSKSVKGSGLGLAMVKKLIVRNGGSIRVYSDGSGSVFELNWPIANAK